MKHDQSNIKKAKKYLDKNNCIGIPTETVYGLAGNAYSDKAVKKIFSLKKRPRNNPFFLILIQRLKDLDKIFYIIKKNLYLKCNHFEVEISCDNEQLKGYFLVFFLS